ncbi:MAG: hypothetical protein R3E32_03955 [Chitinophagales bacterium]
MNRIFVCIFSLLSIALLLDTEHTQAQPSNRALQLPSGGDSRTSTLAWSTMGNTTGIDIALDASNNPWIINSTNDIFRHNGTSWQQYIGSVKALAIAVDSNNTPWVIGMDNSIWTVRNNGRSDSWVLLLDKKGIDIAVGSNGNPWIIDLNNDIFFHNGTSWQQYAGGGKGLAIAVGPDNTPWVIGMDNRVWKGTGSSWVAVAETQAKDLAVDGSGLPWIIGMDGTAMEGTNTRSGLTFQPHNRYSGKAIEIRVNGQPSMIATDNTVWQRR